MLERPKHVGLGLPKQWIDGIVEAEESCICQGHSCLKALQSGKLGLARQSVVVNVKAVDGWEC